MTSVGLRALSYTAALVAGLALSASASAQDITIGAILPLTGPAAAVGLEEQMGVQFAVDRANDAGGIRGRKISVLYEDSQAKPDVGVLTFNKLTDLRGVQGIMTAFSSVSLAIAPLATRKKVLVINPAAQSNQLENASPYLLNTIPLVKDETTVLVKYLVNKLGKKTAGIVYENAAAGIDGKDDFKKAFEAAGGKIVAEEPAEFGQTNYRPSLLKIAALKPDLAYIVITQGHPSLAEQAGQIQGFPVGAGTTFLRPAFGYPGSVGWYQSAIKSGISPELDKEFMTRYKDYAEKAKVKDIPFFAREYFNSTNILLKAIDHVLGKGQQITGENLRAAIFEIKSFGSSVGTITFDKTNTAKRGVEILQYTKDERKLVSVEE